MVDKKLFDFTTIETVYEQEITIFIHDEKYIVETNILPKIEEIINLVVKKDLGYADIKYCIYDFNILKEMFNLDKDINEKDVFVYVKKTKDFIRL